MTYTAHNPFVVSRLPAALVLTIGSALFPAVPQAQQEPPPDTENVEVTGSDSSTVRYQVGFFDQYNPNTVDDMLDWIPGISLALDGGGGGGGGDDGGRGLGGEENILINGQRMAGKSNNPRDQLSRIPAEEVDYIEIIRGSATDLGVRSSGQIVNVVLTGELNRSSVTAEVSADRHHDGTVRPGGNISYTRQQGSLNFLVSAEVEPRYELRDSYETSVLGDLSPDGTIVREEETDQTNIELNTNITYDLTSRDRIQFNALWREEDPPEHIDRVDTDLKTDPPTVTFEREDIEQTEDGWELGGDYEHILENGNRFRILAIATRENEGRFRERFVRDERDGEEQKDLVINSSSIERERIARGAFTWDLSDNHDLELGGEIAQNILESTLFQGTPTADGPVLPETGGLPSVPIDNARAEVEEIRYEPFVVHNWQITPRINMESELIAELSEIEQTGDVNKSRSFDFLRPSIDIRYDLTSSIQLRAQIEKQVSQLSFGQFVASADPNDEDRDTEAGNPELSQEETWRYELNFEYRLPNDLGVINTMAFFEDISNVIDRVDLTPSAPQPTGAAGNIGDAEKYGAEVDLSLRLGFIGLPEALLTSNLRAESSSVTDPILGIDRRLERHGRGSASLGFRHDIPSQQLNYGFDYRYGFNDNRRRFDVNRIESFNSDPFMFAFIQKTAFDGVVFRIESRNFLDNGRCRERRRFASRISDPIPSVIETSCSNDGRRWSLKIRNTF